MPVELFTFELAVLEINIVNDLGDCLQTRIGDTRARKQHFEAAAIPFMGELALEHVETQLPLFRQVALAGDEANNGISIDEAAD